MSNELEMPADLLEQHERALRDLEAPGDEKTLLVVGETPEESERLDSELKAYVQRLMDEQTAEIREENRRLKEQLAEQNERLQKMAKASGEDVERIAQQLAVNEHLEREEWKRTFEGIKRNGNGGYCTVILHSSDDPAKNGPVPVAVNGKKLLLPRNVPVRIHVSYLEVLVNSRVVGMAPEVDSTGNRSWKPIVIQCYPFTITDRKGQGGADPSRLRAA